MSQVTAQAIKDLIKDIFRDSYLEFEICGRKFEVISSGIIKGNPEVVQVSDTQLNLGHEGSVYFRITVRLEEQLKVRTNYWDNKPRLFIPMEHGLLILSKFSGESKTLVRSFDPPNSDFSNK